MIDICLLKIQKYIIEIKEKLSKSVVDHSTKRLHITTERINEKFFQEDERIDKKRLKYKDISTKTSVTISTAVLEQEDCFIVGH